MAIFTEHAEHRHADGSRYLRAAVAWLGLAMVLGLPGCGGCRKTPEAEEQEKQKQEQQQALEKAKKKEKEKEPFEAHQPVTMPAGGNLAGSCKPGHWISQVWPDVKANRGDFLGELQTEIVDRDGHNMPLVGVPYEMTDQRPAALAKEQPKSLESFTWIPPRQDVRAVDFKLAAGRGGPVVFPARMGLEPMPSYRYYFVVLSQAAGRYEYLDKKLASIHLHRAKTDEAETKYYEVVSMRASRRPSLPTNALYWTSIAYLLWDDFDPALWDVDQQRALIDWLHWGGQIIVSGPDALEQLRNSFLRPYLPATVKKSRTLSAHDLEELNYWDWASEVGRSPRPVKPWPGAELKKDPHAAYLPYTGDLLVERQVGRGRIVASAFRLTGPELTGWPGYDCLFNACLLRRPQREFWSDADSERLHFRWANLKSNPSSLDAARNTAVRYFARDTGVGFEEYANDVRTNASSENRAGDSGEQIDRMEIDENGKLRNADSFSIPGDDDGSISFGEKATPGLGAWNDFSPVAQAARTVVANAASISVPERSFIVWVVVGYLCVLVPANWIVFRLLGRVEWAWFAAPVIAIACTVVVIRQAQLNIGFARSRNEIAVIEMQPGYSRVHVARYTALYTSLATRYEFHLNDPAGQILPFPQGNEFVLLVWQAYGELVCRRGDDTQLTGFRVGSNVADFVHSEEMEDFGGTVTLHQAGDRVLRVTNATAHPLDNCQAVRGRSGGRDLATLGRLEPGATAALYFEPYNNREVAVAGNRRKNPDPTSELSVEGVAEVARDRQELRPGEICFVARVADDVPGLTVTPVAQQTRQAAILVAHLAAGRLSDPERDTKLTTASLLASIPKPPKPPMPEAPRPKTEDPGPKNIDLSPQPEDQP